MDLLTNIQMPGRADENPVGSYAKGRQPFATQQIESKQSFFEKKDQKTFSPCRRLWKGPRQRDQKFFAASFKKEGLFSFDSAVARRRPVHDSRLLSSRQPQYGL